MKADFRFMLKNRGAMLAKGFIAGIQFEELFQNSLFCEMDPILLRFRRQPAVPQSPVLIPPPPHTLYQTQWLQPLSSACPGSFGSGGCGS